jgi:hypothetical protein
MKGGRMVEKSVIEGWKLLAESDPNHVFHSSTVLALVEYIEWQDSVNTDLVRECETWEAKYIREEEQEMSHGNA